MWARRFRFRIDSRFRFRHPYKGSEERNQKQMGILVIFTLLTAPSPSLRHDAQPALRLTMGVYARNNMSPPREREALPHVGRGDRPSMIGMKLR